MKRRHFLEVTGGAAAGYTVGCYGLERLLPARSDPSAGGRDHLGLAVEHEATSVCGGCPAGCSVLAKITDGRIIGIRGNPKDPLGLGGLCARGVSEVRAFYEPDRLLGPVARNGAGDFAQISWDAALEQITTRMRALVGAGRGHRVGAVLSSGEGVTAAVARRVLAGIGSPHVYQTSCLRDPAATAFASLTFGEPRAHGYDLDHTDLILSFGTPVLEGFLSPAYVASRFGAGRRRSNQRLQLIQIESRLSPTAMRADEWVRCAAGTEPVLALAIAGVMLREGLARGEALGCLAGLGPWRGADGTEHPGFGRVLDYAYEPHAASQQTGVSVVDILRLARIFARAAAPVALGEQPQSSMGAFGLAAVHLLNALGDRIGRRGGCVFPAAAPVTPLPAAPAAVVEPRLDGPPTAALAGTPIWGVLGRMQQEGREPPFDILFVEDGAALGIAGAGGMAAEMLGRIPLVVSLATGLDASTAAAKIVLPATTYFEQAIDVETAPAGPFVAVAAAKPIVKPLVDGRPVADTFLALGKRIGGAAALAFADVGAVVDYRLTALPRARRGLPYASEFQREWMGQMEAAGWWQSAHAKEPDFVAAIYASGGWVDPEVPEMTPHPDTPYAVDARALADAPAATELFPIPATDDAWVPRAELRGSDGPAAGGLALVPIAVGPLVGRGTPNRPVLLQIAAPHVGGAFRPWAELHPRDAERLGITSYDAVRIVSEYGSVRVSVRISEGTRPGTVAVASAPGAGGDGRYAHSWGLGAERLVAGQSTTAAGVTVAEGLIVQVHPDDSDDGDDSEELPS